MMLYVVSTPIGNLKDITLRALEVLKSVDLIAAEDTRHTKILLDHYQITTPTISCFEHNEIRRAEQLVKLFKEGKNIALVTDAGTPGISDPGYRVIKLAREQDIPVEVVPGPCALVAALSASGLASDSFIFEGFLPVKSAARRKQLVAYTQERRTVIFYESPYRLLKTLADIKEVLNDPQVVCARELTKKFEEVKRGRASELLEYFSRKGVRGEFVLLL